MDQPLGAFLNAEPDDGRPPSAGAMEAALSFLDQTTDPDDFMEVSGYPLLPI